MAKSFATGSLLDATTATQGHVVLGPMPCIHRETVSHSVQLHPPWKGELEQKFCGFGMEAGARSQTGVVSLVRSKEANSRFGELSWAGFQRKCTQHNSNIIMSPCIYEGGNRRSDSI